jgi:hypothetical protein
MNPFPDSAVGVALPALVIPDVHEDYVRAEQIVAAHGEGCASVVFLGDYFDRRSGGAMEGFRRSVAWLLKSLRDPRRVHLLGNHDRAYLYCSPDTFCTGWDDQRHAVFAHEVGEELGWMRERMALAVQAGPWLLSHAGFGPICRDASVAQLLTWANNALRALPRQGGRGHVHRLNGCGRVRGGYESFGGLTWLDWDHEFQPLPGIHQLVGHTVDRAPRYRHLNDEGRLIAGELSSRNPSRLMAAKVYRSMNWCLDAGLHAWCIVHPDRLEVHCADQVLTCEAPEAGVGARRFSEIEMLGLAVEAGDEPPLRVSVEAISRLLGVEDLRRFDESLLPDLSIEASRIYIEAHTPVLVREFMRRVQTRGLFRDGPAPHEVDKALRALRRRGLLTLDPSP